MGFLVASETDHHRVVATVNGKASVLGEHHPKSRVWVLEDRTAVLCLPAVNGGIERRSYTVTVSRWHERPKLLEIDLADGGTLTVDAKGCGCGMGSVGAAGPVDGRYNTVRVRAPEWHTVLP